MSELRALIFDVDGTLAETERDGHLVAFNRAFKSATLDWEWSVALYGELLEVAGGKERIRHYLTQYQPNFEPPDNLDQFISHLHALKTKYYKELLATGAIPLRLGVKRLLKEARAQEIQLAIATTSTEANVSALLEQFLDPSWFEVIAAGDIVPAKKPAPDIYHYVLNALKLAPSECLVFEDSSAGLQASTAAGLQTIVTVNDYTKEQDFAAAILVLDHLGEPDSPATVLKGDLGNYSYVNLDLLRGIGARE